MEIYNSERNIIIDQLIAEHGVVITAFLNWKSDIATEEIADTFNKLYRDHWDDEVEFATSSSEVIQKLNWKQFSETFPFWSECVDWEQVATKLFEQEYHKIWVNEYDSDSWGIWVFKNSD
ncbi:hypothetical protein HW132_07030 [Brasilonema sp. CT11]|nr:hypothetical protein [Brasilonema sp. CT11]